MNVARTAAAARRRPAVWTLHRRLIVGIAAVVASTLLIMGILSIATLSASATSFADTQLNASMSAFNHSVKKFGGASTDDTRRVTTRNRALVDFPGQGRGSVIAILRGGAVIDSSVFEDDGAVVLTENETAVIEDAVSASGASGENRIVDLGELGRYRIETAVSDGDVLVAGVPLAAAETALMRQIVTITILIIAALFVTVAGAIVVVRLALRSLARVVETAVEVTSLRLDVGDRGISTRVAATDTDPRTEAGKVGEALNQLLDHMDTVLSVRAATDRRMRRFVTDASHELRTPLAAIQGYAELTRQDSAELPEMTEYSLARIESEARRMSSLVSGLLLLARLDEGQDLHVTDVDLADLLLNAVNDARASGSTHIWIAEVPETPVLVRGDRERLHQLVANLLSNARVHTPDSSTVTARLRTGAPGLPVELSVQDDGPGIAADLLPVIFERFARGDTARASGTAGARSTGLGLAIALSIAEAHGGTIRVTSALAETGTTFTVTFPSAHAKVEAEALS